MNHECPHCYVNLKQHGLATRLVKVGNHTGFYPCCPYCRTVLDLNIPPKAQKISVVGVVLVSFVLSQSIDWFEGIGYAYKDALLLSFLCLIVFSVLSHKLILRLLPADFALWRMVARPAYFTRFAEHPTVPDHHD
jgi:hypothetical protein